MRILCIFYTDLHQAEYGNLPYHDQQPYQYHVINLHVLPYEHPRRSLQQEVLSTVQPQSNASMHSVHNWYGISSYPISEPAPDGFRECRLQVQPTHLPHESWSQLLFELSLPSLQYEPDEFVRLRLIFQVQFLQLLFELDQSLIR